MQPYIHTNTLSMTTPPACDIRGALVISLRFAGIVDVCLPALATRLHTAECVNQIFGFRANSQDFQIANWAAG